MDALILNGSGLTLEDIWEVVYLGRRVEISEDAFKRLAKGREIMQKLANEGKPIYGFNRGVGQNKDVVIDDEAIDLKIRRCSARMPLGCSHITAMKKCGR